MHTQTFTWGGAEITVRPAVVQDRLDTEIVMFTMGQGETVRERHAQRNFGKFITQSEVKGDLGFAWPTLDASPAELNEAFSHWRSMPGALYDQWDNALTAVDTTPNDPDLTPAASEKNDTTPAS